MNQNENHTGFKNVFTYFTIFSFLAVNSRPTDTLLEKG